MQPSSPKAPLLAWLFPASNKHSLWFAAIVSAAMGICDVLFATTIFRDYGLVLFVATPCFLGIAAPLLHSVGAPRTFLQCFAAAMVAQLALFAGMVLFAIEGIICVIMAAPLWITCAVVGACIAYPIQRALWSSRRPGRGFPLAGLLILVVLPLFSGAEHLAAPPAPTFVLTSFIDIDAPLQIVWNNLVQFPELPPPQQWLFRMGVAYPIGAKISGTGPGASRYCIFSTGNAAETVTTWNEPHVLEFDVTSTPPSMREWSIYPNLQPPHLEGYLTSRHARFQLIALPNGKTRLIGTSWYQNRMFPVAYWQLWSDAIIHQIHMRVFAHIKNLSEAAAHPLLTPPPASP